MEADSWHGNSSSLLSVDKCRDGINLLIFTTNAVTIGYATRSKVRVLFG